MCVRRYLFILLYSKKGPSKSFRYLIDEPSISWEVLVYLKMDFSNLCITLDYFHVVSLKISVQYSLCEFLSILFPLILHDSPLSVGDSFTFDFFNSINEKSTAYEVHLKMLTFYVISVSIFLSALLFPPHHHCIDLKSQVFMALSFAEHYLIWDDQIDIVHRC